MKNNRRIEHMALGEIAPAARNPKLHDLAAIKASISRFGFADAVVIDERTGRLVSGHGRVEALTEMRAAGVPAPDGVEASATEWRIPVQRGWSSTTDAEAEAFLVAANRLVEIGKWDEAALSELLKGHADAGTLDGVGYDVDALDKIAADLAPEPTGDTEDVPDPTEIYVKPGQLFEIGKHRIMCGDSTSTKDVDRLVGTRRFDLVWTDPPYGIDYVGGPKPGKKRGVPIANDGAGDISTLLSGVFAQCFRVLVEGAFIYVAHPSHPVQQGVFFETFRGAGFEQRQSLIWVKDAFAISRVDYHPRHEPVIYGWKPGVDGRRRMGGTGWFGDNAQSSVFEFPKPKRSDLHPTMKPVELVEAMVRNSSAPGHFVFEPFSGSGTTLLACERLQRICYAMELEPRFVQVAIERWEGFTGQKAKLVVDAL